MMDKISVFGKDWHYGMEGGRRVHPNNPNVVFTEKCVNKFESEFGETIEFKTNKLKEPIITRHWDGKDYVSNYESGGITSCDDYSYGTFTLMCKMPKGSGQHAAFWLSGEKSWPPEIDCFESFNKLNGKTLTWPDIYSIFKNKYSSDLLKWNFIMPARRIQPNIHWGTIENHKSTNAFNTPVNFFYDPYNKFNEYKIVWTPDKIEIFYNRNLVMKCIDKNVLDWFNKDHLMYVVINNNYIPDIQNCKKDEIEMEKTPFVVYGFEYEPI